MPTFQFKPTQYIGLMYQPWLSKDQQWRFVEYGYSNGVSRVMEVAFFPTYEKCEDALDFLLRHNKAAVERDWFRFTNDKATSPYPLTKENPHYKTDDLEIWL